MSDQLPTPGGPERRTVGLSPVEDLESARVAEELSAGRPVPSAAIRSRIGAIVAAADVRARPAHLRLLIVAYAIAGLLVLAIVGAGVAGIGPLAG